MRLQRRSLLAGLLAALVLAPNVSAVCAFPVYIRAEVGTSLSTSRAVVDAAGFAEARNFQGEPCDFPIVTATVTITRNGAAAYTLTKSAPGSVTLTATGPAEVGNCYASSIVASGSLLQHGTGTGAERCWVGPRPGPYSALCPLILDLNGDGIHTTGLESPVRFWNFSGVKTDSGWTDPATEEAFLWLDSETDHAVEEAELFGSRMPSPAGGVHSNGFQALEKYDREEFGGNSDGRITTADRIWGRLRLWVDRDHNGIADATEISPPSRHRIVALNLDRAHDHTSYPNGNGLMLVGSYVRRTAADHFEQREMVDVGFIYPP
jgi:hypothetical protein